MMAGPQRHLPRRGGGRAAWGWALLLAVGTLAALYAWLHRPAGPAGNGDAEQVVIATNIDYVGSCPVVAGLERGYFADEGILAVLQAHSSGKAAMEAVLQGKANLGTVADIPIMFAGLNDSPVSVIASFFKTEKDHGIVGRRDNGVVTPASLKGKRIGVSLSTSGHFTLDAFLNRQLLRSNEVIMRNYKPEEMAAALEQGDVDAVASWEPFLTQMQSQLGSNAVVFYGQDVYESIYNLAAMRNYVASRPETIKKVLRALVRGASFCAGQPEAARAVLAARTKGDQSKWQASWPSYRFSVVLDQGLILALEDQARWAIKNKMTQRTEVPNYLDYVYLDGLEAVQPSAVTIIH
ncbi:NitT/TauT family transport system substrate-binding protein [Janthinobacterium sp. CG_23.3]|uniref:ABC transporter substrate-binding protein n=1 Tax=unclassified Janthinobacterium TaxID=2610881 RepID=UPI0003457796|nr:MULTISPECIES: NrtA/SsuA/CpmA family ABC transporter substrate-binding protein [unclassified Janthinobacterium]MEC5159291.1 NitT/TauT family transport system substrate-binding protein [Janthinobacterium sp. CG_S6]